ncbi:MAG: elongation factor 1-beta [Candidatus Aenigmatarchaeota archaeon]|nr:MAG: elongation factor 1-beta [Candidatus Aenigmarchaeota archaeon]
MGEVIVVFRIMPESPEDFDKVKAGLEKLEPERLEEEPIAFGLKAIKFTKIVPDAEGEIDRLEEEIKRIEGVKDLETVLVSRRL